MDCSIKEWLVHCRGKSRRSKLHERHRNAMPFGYNQIIERRSPPSLFAFSLDYTNDLAIFRWKVCSAFSMRFGLQDQIPIQPTKLHWPKTKLWYDEILFRLHVRLIPNLRAPTNTCRYQIMFILPLETGSREVESTLWRLFLLPLEGRGVDCVEIIEGKGREGEVSMPPKLGRIATRERATKRVSAYCLTSLPWRNKSFWKPIFAQLPGAAGFRARGKWKSLVGRLSLFAWISVFWAEVRFVNLARTSVVLNSDAKIHPQTLWDSLRQQEQQKEVSFNGVSCRGPVRERV